MTEAQNKIFCFGFGYCCDYFAHSLQSLGNWKIAGTTRDADKSVLMRDRGIKSFIFDYEKPLNDPQLFLQNVTHLLISTPPNDDGDPTFCMHEQDIAALSHIKWIGYLSSTNVYGNRGGELVDETVEVQPDSQRGTRRAKAEEQWLSLYQKHGLPVHIFRLSGIYGPGRSALDSVRAGIARRIDKPGHAFSRIHVEDIVKVLIASIENPSPGSIYNVSDNEAAPSHEIISYACELLGQEPPPLVHFDEADLAPIARSFYSDNKRIDNSKIKNELGVELLYPDYRAGLKACLEAEQHHADGDKDLISA